MFQYNSTASTLQTKTHLGTGHEFPYGSLLNASDEKLYGMTYAGGSDNKGSIIQYDPAASTYIKKFDLGGIYGSSPYGSFIQTKDGYLYGLTSHGGLNDEGVIFKYNLVNSKYDKVFDFDNITQPDGKFPYGTFLKASNGKLYGMTYSGGTNNMGTLFEYNIEDSVFIKKLDFNKINGARPYYTQLIEINTSTNSIEENDPLNAIDIFPNPTKGITYLKTNPNEKCKIRSLEVYNAFGEQLYNVTQLNDLSIDLSSQPNGIYIIKVGSEIKKVVKF